MARRILSRLLLAVGLLGASLAWVGFTLQRTVFDSSRSERVAAALLGDDELQDTLVDRTTDALVDALPPSTAAEVSRAELEQTARRALASPSVAAALQATLVDTHRYLVGEAAEPPEVSSASLDEALRAQLVAVDPDLAEVVPQLPTITIQLPDAGLSATRAVRERVDQLTALAALVALGGVAGALLVARDRARVLRRLGWWALAAAGLWLVVGLGLPALAEALVPESAAVVGALVDVLAGGMVTPALVLAGAGLVAVVAATLLGRSRGRAGAGRARSASEPLPLPSARRSPSTATSRARPVPPPPAAGVPAPRRVGRTGQPPGGPRAPEPTRRLPVVPPAGAAAPGAPAAPAASAVAAAQSAPVTEPLPSTAPERSAGPSPGRRERDDGRERHGGPWGYAWQPEEPPAEGARWLEGVGYVDSTGEAVPAAAAEPPLGEAEPFGDAGPGSDGTPRTATPRG